MPVVIAARKLNGVRLENLGLVLRLLQNQGPLSRRDLVHLTGLMPSTVTYITGDLISAGVVRDLGLNGPRQTGGPGRRTTLLGLVPHGGYAVGVHLGVRGVHAMLTDLGANVLDQQHVAVDFSAGPEAVSKDIADVVRQLSSRTGIDPQRLIGVGVGVVGWVDPTEGVVREAPHDGWNDVPLRDLLVEHLRVPIVIEHNVRAMAVAERWIGHAVGMRNFILVTVGTVIGVGIVANGEVVRGYRIRAGQIGHTRVRDNGPICRCGKTGCLDALASDAAIAARARVWANDHPDTPLAEYVQRNTSPYLQVAVFTAAANGDAVAQQIIAEVAGDLARALAMLVSALDPEAVIVVGGITELGDQFFDPLREALKREIAAGAPTVSVAPSSLVRRDIKPGVVPALGAASLALEHFYTKPWQITAWLAQRRPDRLASMSDGFISATSE